MRHFEGQPGVDETLEFLQSGIQTRITPEIQEIAVRMRGQNLERVRQIIDFVSSFRYTKFDPKIFRKRTATQIIQDGFITGCTDFGLVFIVLARACGLPTKYVETIDKVYLKKGGHSVSGHIYARIYDDAKKRWILVDPMGGEVDIPEPTKRVIFKEGLDSWDIGINDVHSLREQFKKFREAWLQKQKE